MTGELPPPCPDCEPYGGLGRLVVQNDNEAIENCPCPRGKALKAAGEARNRVPSQAEPVVSSEAANHACEILGALLENFTLSEVGRAAVAAELRALCTDESGLLWLTVQLPRLYSKWPGAREVRILYCSRFRPLSGADLVSAVSESYPDGFPPESPADALRQIESGPMLALPPGHVVSASPTIERAVQELAQAKDLNRIGQPAPKVHDVPVIRKTTITQSDIDKAQEAYREKKARAELIEEVFGVSPENNE